MFTFMCNHSNHRQILKIQAALVTSRYISFVFEKPLTMNDTNHSSINNKYYVINKGADQTANWFSLISACFVRSR